MILTTQEQSKAVRQINAHLQGGSNYCYVYTAQGNCMMRISRARTRKGVLEGRVVAYLAEGEKPWREIPTDARVALTYF